MKMVCHLHSRYLASVVTKVRQYLPWGFRSFLLVSRFLLALSSKYGVYTSLIVSRPSKMTSLILVAIFMSPKLLPGVVLGYWFPELKILLARCVGCMDNLMFDSSSICCFSPEIVCFMGLGV